MYGNYEQVKYLDNPFYTSILQVWEIPYLTKNIFSEQVELQTSLSTQQLSLLHFAHQARDIQWHKSILYLSSQKWNSSYQH